MAINWKSPWVIGGIGAAVVVLLLVMRSGGASSSGVTATSLVAADQTNAQLAQLATGLQGAQAGFANQLAITNANNGAAEVISANQTGYGMTAALFSWLTKAGDNNTALAANGQQIGGDIAKTAITADATQRLAPELASIQANSNQALARINADTTLSLYPLVAQNQQMLTWLSGNTAINLASLNTQAVEAQAVAAENIAGTQADAAVNRQLIATGGQIIGGAMGGGIMGGGGGGGGGGGMLSGGLGGFF